MSKAINWFRLSASGATLLLAVGLFTDDLVTAVVGGSFLITAAILITGASDE